MSDGLKDKRERMLGRFADLAFELAEQIHADAMAADTAAERAALARDFHMVGRALRQTLALEARLARDAAEAARQATADARTDEARRASRRRDQIEARVRPLIWSEHEASEAEALEDTLHELLEDAAAGDDFLEGPVEAQIETIRTALGLAGPPPSASPPPPPHSAVQGRSEASAPSSSPEGHTSGEGDHDVVEGALRHPPSLVSDGPWSSG